MPITFSNHLDDDATDAHSNYIKSLLAKYIASESQREPTEKGTAFLAAMVLPDRKLTKWEASCCIEALDFVPVTYFKQEHERKLKNEKLTSASTGAALRSVFPNAYKVLFG